MIVSKEWLNDHINISLHDNEIESGLTALGLECTLYKQALSFNNVYIGKVIDCLKHPNADKLKVCKVDIGKTELLTIVCGAPNVRKNINVPVAIINASLNNGKFKITKSRIRGVESEGMICSEKELEISDNHEGIMILNDNNEVGLSFANFLSNDKNKIFELDLTPNRGDCFSHLGVAREIAVLEKNKIITKDFKVLENCNINDFVKISIKESNACLRYTSRVLKGVKVKESPKWLSDRLLSIGQKPINNIVDAANYVMMDTGHPLHTFDLDKINNNKINIRYAKNNEKIELLDGKQYDLGQENLVISDHSKAIAVAGVMGDNQTGISDDTVNILIESAYFNPSVIRKSAKYLGLSTESSKRFERGTDIVNVSKSLDQITELIIEIAGANDISNIIDLYPQKHNSSLIQFDIDDCNKFLGTKLSKNEVENYFSYLNIVYKQDEKSCSIPTYRNDIYRQVDLFEEVARVYGYDNIPLNETFVSNYKTFCRDEFEMQDKIKSYLMSNGYFENYSNSLVNDKDVEKFSSVDPVKLSNPLSNKMQFLRTSLLPGLLKSASFNIKRSFNNFKLFETGVIHKLIKNIDRKSVETNFISTLIVDGEVEHWRRNEGHDYFSIKGEIIALFKFLRFKKIEFINIDFIGFEQAFLIKIDKVKIGYWGKINKNILKDYRINNDVFGLELNYNKINDLYLSKDLKFISPNKFPSIKRDIAIEVNSNIMSQDIEKTILDNGGIYLKEIILFDIYKGEKIEKNKISLAYSIKFQSDKKTLTDNEIDDAIALILKNLKEDHNAKQR